MLLCSPGNGRCVRFISFIIEEERVILAAASADPSGPAAARGLRDTTGAEGGEA